MADSKITALTSIGTSTDPANDPLVLVDVSDTSMAATGTTKKVTLNNLLSTSPTATGNFTITGDLTVRTNKLAVTSVGVGMGTASPAYALDVAGGVQVTSGSAGGLYQWAYGASASSRSWRAWNDVSANGDFQISTSTTRTGSTYSDRYRIDVSGVHQWSNGSGVGMTLDASQNLGLGVAPSAWVSYQKAIDFGGAGNYGSISARANYAAFATNCYFDGTNWVYKNNNPALKYEHSSGQHIWRTAGAGTGNVAFTQAMTLNANGALALQGGNTSANGVGIAFPATQVASSDANTLDDYEEGTFTPTVRGSSTAGTGTYTTQFGRYTKVGRLVTVSVTLVWTAHTGTGNIQFAGLPFASANTSGAYDGICIAYQSNIASAANTVLYGLVEFGSTVVTMTATPVGGGAYGLVAMDTAGEIAFTATYTV